jgi:DNA recombination protein RmuC
MDLITLFVALIFGGFLGFWIATFIKNKELETEKKLLDTRSKDVELLEARFQILADKILKEQSKEFKEDFQNKEDDIGKIVDKLTERVGVFEKERSAQFGELGEKIKTVIEAGTKIQETTASLKAVLSSSSAVRGRWGETTLKNILEESGLIEGSDFFTQETIYGDQENSLRPDVVIKMPGALQLAVDSKASLENFLRAVEEEDESKKTIHLSKFAQDIRLRIKDLSSKEYQKYLDTKVPYVVMFVPSEAAIRAVFEVDTQLYKDAQAKKVMIASPTTIVPLVLLIAHAWKQHNSVENAAKVIGEVAVLGDRLKTFIGHAAGVSSALSSATERFNKMASSWDTRVHTQIEKINQFGGNLTEVSTMPQIESEPRPPHKIATIDKPLHDED